MLQVIIEDLSSEWKERRLWISVGQYLTYNSSNFTTSESWKGTEISQMLLSELQTEATKLTSESEIKRAISTCDIEGRKSLIMNFLRLFLHNVVTEAKKIQDKKENLAKKLKHDAEGKNDRSIMSSSMSSKPSSKPSQADKSKAKAVGIGVGVGVAAGAVAGTVGIIVAAPLVLGAAGFTTGGIALGSYAAAWMSSIGNVAAGSLFATLQSAGAAGIGATTVAAGTAAGAAVGGAVGGAAGNAIGARTATKKTQGAKDEAKKN